MVTQSGLADLRGANCHGFGHMQGDGGVVSDGLVVQSGAITFGKT